MSAVASPEFVTPKPILEAVAAAPSPANEADREMYRWMIWFGLPSLVGVLFLGAVFATDQMWFISGAIAAVILAISMLIWLAMSSDTNAA